MANLLINLPEEMGGLGFPSPGNHAGRVAGGGQVVQALDGRSRGSRFWAHKAKGVVFVIRVHSALPQKSRGRVTFVSFGGGIELSALGRLMPLGGVPVVLGAC